MVVRHSQMPSSVVWAEQRNRFTSAQVRAKPRSSIKCSKIPRLTYFFNGTMEPYQALEGGLHDSGLAMAGNLDHTKRQLAHQRPHSSSLPGLQSVQREPAYHRS